MLASGDSHTRFPIGLSFPAGSGLVAFAGALGFMPLDMPESVLVRFKGQMQPGVTLRDLVLQQEGRGIVIQDMRQKKVKTETARPEKVAPVLAVKKEVAPKAPLINSVFNLARQS